MRLGLRDTMRVKHVFEARGEKAAIESALENLDRGDLLPCQVDQVEDALGWIENKLVALDTQWASRAATARANRYSASDLLSMLFSPRNVTVSGK